MNRRLSLIVVLAMVVLTIALPAAAQRLTIERVAAVVEYKRFDPSNPPAELPELGPEGAAITQYRFSCDPDVGTTVVGQRRVPARMAAGARGAPGRGTAASAGDPGCVAAVRITSIRLTLQLTATVWLPVRARQKLVDHEDGHRVIVERIYDEFAEDAARQAARRWIGQTSTGEAKTCPAALQAAISRVMAEVSAEYMKSTSDWARRVGDRYDAITDHSRRPIGEAEAMEQAFRAEPQNPRMKDEG